MLKAMLGLMTLVWTFITRSYDRIVKKRVHVWAAYYFIGIWTLLEPMITFFGFSDATIELSKNLGLSFFPLVVLLAWFHGEPGHQNFSFREGTMYFVGAIVAFLMYSALSSKPPILYTVLTPHSRAQNQWLHENVLREFEQKFNVKIALESIQGNYEERLFEAFKAESDSFRTLLVKTPLIATGRLLKETERLVVAYDDFFTEDLDGTSDRESWFSRFDPYALRFGKKLTSDRKLYFLPAEFQVIVMVYSKSKVAAAVQNWVGQRSRIDSTYFATTGYVLPPHYELETDPNRWDTQDLFVVSCYWASQEYHGETAPRLASPCAFDMQTFSVLLNKALSLGATLDEVYNLPFMKDRGPPDAIVQMFCWEAVFRQAKLYYPGMWLGSGLTEQEIIEILKAGEVFMAPVTNHAVSELLASNPDLAIATLSAGSSFSGEQAVRRGFSQLWFWSVPKASPSYELSRQLAVWLTEKENQRKMAKDHLFIPTLNELLDETLAHLDSDWEVFLDQIKINKRGLREINPYKDAIRPEPEILLHYYYKKWHEIVKQTPTTPKGICNKNFIIGLLII